MRAEKSAGGITAGVLTGKYIHAINYPSMPNLFAFAS